jgi:hypothetical protein
MSVFEKIRRKVRYARLDWQERAYELLCHVANRLDPNRKVSFEGCSVTLTYQNGYQQQCAACRYCATPTQTSNATCARCSA